jgi:alkaline phosphatase D
VAISRRSFLLGGAGALALAACSHGSSSSKRAASATSTTRARARDVTVPTTSAPATPLKAAPFALGVASGDPDATSVVLWTRLAGATGDHEVVWEVAEDESFSSLVAAGKATASDDDAHSLRVIADGLVPDTRYWYRFTAGSFTSPPARTRTTPRDGAGDRLRFAFLSCQDWQDGFYTAHAHLAREDVDLFVFLGDYIYESGISTSSVRQHDSKEAISLDDYRGRYALYKSDPNLQAVHARGPWLTIWDDHEVDNDYAGEVPEQKAPKGVDFVARRAAAYRAWWEHTPTRLPKPTGDVLEIYRTLEWGSLATFFALDGRQHRDDQPCEPTLGAACPARDDPKLSMLGPEQEAWIARELPSSTSTWNVVANQTVLSPAPIRIGSTSIFNMDQWDGYPAAQRRMLEVLGRSENAVVITGDIHASAVGDVRLDGRVVASELVGTSISSDFPGVLAGFFEGAAKDNGAQMADAVHRGYVVCEVTPKAFRADYRIVDTVKQPTAKISTSSSWKIAAGTPGVTPAS